MNSLTEFVIKYDMRPRMVMNILQDKGLVSDNAILLEDVAEKDCAKAIEHLRQYIGFGNPPSGYRKTCRLCKKPMGKCVC